ncbi:MAG: class I SAM-dependent methyltransferase [Pseudomonadota bacterium]
MTVPWHDDDAFWRDFDPVMFDEDRFAAAPAEIEALLGLVQVRPPGSVLDLCCGPGRHAVELARRGFTVTGVDRTAAYLERAGARASDAGLQVEWVQDDMRHFVRPRAFDLAVNLFTAFGYFEDPAQDRQVLDKLRQSLKPGGVLVMDLLGKEILARKFRQRDWDRLADGTLIIEDRELQHSFGWIRNQWTLLRQGQTVQVVVEHRLYAASELEGLLRDVGFDQVQSFGSLHGTPYDHEAERLVVVARR